MFRITITHQNKDLILFLEDDFGDEGNFHETERLEMKDFAFIRQLMHKAMMEIHKKAVESQKGKGRLMIIGKDIEPNKPGG